LTPYNLSERRQMQIVSMQSSHEGCHFTADGLDLQSPEEGVTGLSLVPVQLFEARK